MMRKLIGVIVAVAAVSITTAAVALASSGGPSPVTYTGQGLPLSTQLCGNDADNGGITGDVSGQYLLWNLPGVPSTATNVTITLPDGTHPMQFNGTWKYISPVWDEATLVNLPVTAQWDGGGEALNLTVSHGCTQAKSDTSTTIHQGVADNGAPVLPTGDLGSIVHDSAAITVENGGSIPTGSTVKFSWFENKTCTGEPVAQSGDLDATSGSVDPALPEGPLHAGDYSYKAAFTSGDSSVANSVAGCEPLHINQGQLAIVTQIHGVNGAHDPVGGSAHVALGSTVHDTATVSVANGGYGGFTVPGANDVSFTLDDGSGPAAVAQDPAGEAGFTARTIESHKLAAGSYTYAASVAGNDDYIGATSTDEPLTVDKAQLGVATVLHGINGAHNDVTNTHQALGSTVHDTATISGQVDGFDAPTTADISFTRDGNAVTKAADESAGVASTVESAPLAAGSYTYKAHVDGNSNYIGASSADEALTIDKAQLGITTDIHNASHVIVTSVPPLSVVHDTATVTGQVAGFDIGAISFTLNGNAVANGSGADGTTTAHSVDSSPLQPGSYTYKASVAGNDNYIGANSADEPLSVTAVFGKTMGFWGNQNGIARIIAAGGYSNNSVTIGRGAVIDTQAEAAKVLPSTLNACGKGSTIIFTGQTSSVNCSLATGVNIGTLNTAAAQTLALGYNLKLVANFSGQTLGAMGITGLPAGLTGSSTVNDAFVYAVSLINGSASGGTTTQSKLGALNTMLGLINREA